MILFGILLNLIYHGSLSVSGGPLDCVEAERGCLLEQACMGVYGLLEYCVAEEAVSPLGADARRECLEAQSALQKQRPLQTCKCQRGSRREEHCLRVYWTVRFAAYDEYEVSPYEELEVELVRNMELSRMASIMAASSLPLDGQNLCLKAAQDCGLYEKCGSLRSEYVVACTKRAPGSDGSCNRQKCHRALRRFLERVPEEYSLALLFCPCSDALCGERRRKTIVPSCSYEERDGKPNCLSLQGYCIRDELCRSRLADFQHNCQPSSQSPSGCMRESGAVCLKAYAGLIGTIMTPNYVSNRSTEVSQWCSCEGSGNQWQDCRHVLHMFSSNACLLNAISSMGTSPLRPVENIPQTPPHPTPRLHEDKVHVYVNVLPDVNNMEDSEEAEEEEEEEENSQEFSIIPPYSENDASVGSGARGSHRAAASQTAPMVPLLLLPACTLGWGGRG
ncbi:GDNF family receptor alpha-4-like [Hypomesus transpacificus]|uniref:GDNF family receptor alpha-4-like n=1 Tax=Hypomesus transpacificus TaxID=137520 RepID=UPI001F0797E4|nr:GDNF family receptor alpha-4-like [Hypomesus transpacificus]XP_046899177.1 GDNF family receptor alpha-4-like [Hypomesus transpacificus]